MIYIVFLLIGLMIGLSLLLVISTVKKGKFGINFNSLSYPKCGPKSPDFTDPAKQSVWAVELPPIAVVRLTNWGRDCND